MSVNIYDSSTDTLTRVDNSYGIINCSTARSTAAKVVALSGFKLYKGARITVRFTDTGSSNPSSGNLSLNVNSTGAKTIVDGHTNKTVLTYSNANYFYNNQVADFVYDGTNWVYLNRDKDTTYNGSSLKTNAAKTGTAQSAITDTIAASTTMDNAIGTLLNNDKTLESGVQTLKNNEDAILNVLGAKNLLPNNATSQTINGVTFTVNGDGSITANGTATANINFRISNISYPKGGYILSGCPQGGGTTTYRLGIIGVGSDVGNGYNVSLSQDTIMDICIIIANGATVSNKIFYPMIRPASVADDTYVPYAKTNKQLTDDLNILEGLTYDSSKGAINGYYAKVGHVAIVSFRITLATAINNTWTEIGKITKALPTSIPIYTNKQFTWVARNSTRGGYIQGYAMIDPNSAYSGTLRAETGTAQIGDVLYITFSYITT